MGLTLKQKRVAKNMFFYIVATEKLEELSERYAGLNDEEKEDFEELKCYIEEFVEANVMDILMIPPDLMSTIDFVKTKTF